MIIVLLSFLTLALKNVQVNLTALRMMRVTRILRMLKASKGIRRIIRAFYFSIDQLLNVFFLLLLFLFVFAVAAMALFGSV